MDGLKEILDKISTYNLFNYLLPGILFVFISKEFTDLDLIQDNIVIGGFLYYFVGMVISRFGSILIEPLLKKVKFLKFADYKKFVLACKQDEKIDILSEANNTYRTLLSTFVLLLIVKGFMAFKLSYGISDNSANTILISLLAILFLFSYRKQTNYISKRIDASN